MQIDILDVAIREPQIIKANIRRKESYMCTDKLVVTEENTKMLTVCGEDKTNLVQYRTKSNHVTVELKNSEFSPTRGILFRYSCNLIINITIFRVFHIQLIIYSFLIIFVPIF